MKTLEHLEKFKLLIPSAIIGGTDNSDEGLMNREGMFEYKDKRGG